MALLECIPNVSEGHSPEIINQLTESIKSVPGVRLLHVDTGVAANRTVFTFVGEPQDVFDAALQLYEKSAELIDMTKHTGTHPRQGAIDVCPFVPLKDITENEAVALVNNFGKLVGKRLGIPGYFYEENATAPDRRNLAILRRGEYEALPKKFKNLPPDFGDHKRWKHSGATVIGVRKMLIAYNINLNTKDVKVARTIAEAVRESGKITLNEKGEKVRVLGHLKSVKGLGWYIDDFQVAQVSYNLTDLNQAGMLDVYLTTVDEAGKLGFQVTGSELVGLAPVSEFLKAGRHFSDSKDKNKLISAAIMGLNLNQFNNFEPDKKIIENLL